jgi:hypothetical protein
MWTMHVFSDVHPHDVTLHRCTSQVPSETHLSQLCARMLRLAGQSPLRSSGNLCHTDLCGILWAESASAAWSCNGTLTLRTTFQRDRARVFGASPHHPRHLQRNSLALATRRTEGSPAA